jgi:branched-chain amino acid transport system substrate-binding protein
MLPRLTLFWTAFLVLVVLITPLFACSSATTESSIIRIGLIVPQTGDLADVGQAGLEAAELFIDEINAAGGLEIDGQRHQLSLVVADNAGTTEQTVSAARSLINQEAVVAIVGPYTSNNAIAVADVADQSRIPIISPWSTNPDATAGKTYMFRVGFTDTFQGQVIAQFARAALDADTAAVLYDEASAYNRGLAGYFQDAFNAAGGQVVAFESYTTDAPDPTTQLGVIEEQAPDILFLPNYHHEIPGQVQHVQAHNIEADLLGSDSWLFIKPEQRSDLDGTFFTAHYLPESASPENQAFVAAYGAQYDRLPNDIDALTYDAFGVLAAAMQRAQSIQPEAIQAGLSTLRDYAGVTGSITYNNSGDPIKSVIIVQFQQGETMIHQIVNVSE